MSLKEYKFDFDKSKILVREDTFEYYLSPDANTPIIRLEFDKLIMYWMVKSLRDIKQNDRSVK